MNKIVIADIHSLNNHGRSSGHYFPVAQNYLDMFGDKILVAGGPIYRQMRTDQILQLPFDTKVGQNSFINKLHTLINCYKLFSQTKGDVIIMQSVALVITYIGILLFFRKGNSRLFIIQYYTRSIESKFQKRLWKWASKKVNGIICTSSRVGQKFALPYIVIPDYIYTKSELPQLQDYRNRIYDFCLVGTIQDDKGQIEALNALKNKGTKIVIAGKPATQEMYQQLEQIAAEDPSIEMRLGYVSDEDYFKFLKNSKYCLLNYRGTYNDRSSGVILDALFSGTPVVGNKCKALTLVKEYSLGHLYDDVYKFDYQQILDNKQHETYTQNIINYISKQKETIKTLENFINK